DAPALSHLRSRADRLFSFIFQIKLRIFSPVRRELSPFSPGPRRVPSHPAPPDRTRRARHGGRALQSVLPISPFLPVSSHFSLFLPVFPNFSQVSPFFTYFLGLRRVPSHPAPPDRTRRARHGGRALQRILLVSPHFSQFLPLFLHFSPFLPISPRFLPIFSQSPPCPVTSRPAGPHTPCPTRRPRFVERSPNFSLFLPISAHFSQFLPLFLHFSPFLPVFPGPRRVPSHPAPRAAHAVPDTAAALCRAFSQFLPVSARFSPFLLVPAHFSPFLPVLPRFSPISRPRRAPGPPRPPHMLAVPDMAAPSAGLRQRRPAGPGAAPGAPGAAPAASPEPRLGTAASPLSPGTFWLTRIVLLRSIAFLYFVAFLVAFQQNKQLIGEKGLLPCRLYLQDIKKYFKGKVGLDALSYAPTLIWFLDWSAMDSTLDCLALAGLAGAAFVLLTGCANMVLMALLWLLYLSLVNVGQIWYSFGK
uniref:Lipase maturation factor 1 n=1 Tax=Taeniopygia guttata TaxID=59729 RepID=A0A674HVW9_TAEGU